MTKEQEILVRVYRFLEKDIEIDDDSTPFAQEIYALQEEIERVVPGEHLDPICPKEFRRLAHDE